MIAVRKIANSDILHCTHCDKLAKYKIHIDNPQVIQNSPVAALCPECMKDFEGKMRLERNDLCGELIKLAALILVNAPFPSTFPEDWNFPKTVPQYFQRALMENANKLDEMKKSWVVQMKEMANKIRGLSISDEK